MRIFIDDLNFDLSSSKMIVFNLPKHVEKNLQFYSGGTYFDQFRSLVSTVFGNYYKVCDYSFAIITSAQGGLSNLKPPDNARYIIFQTENDFGIENADTYFDIESLSGGLFQQRPVLQEAYLKLVKGKCVRKTYEYMINRCSHKRRIVLVNGNLISDGDIFDFIHACTLNLHKYYDVSKMTINKYNDFFEL